MSRVAPSHEVVKKNPDQDRLTILPDTPFRHALPRKCRLRAELFRGGESSDCLTLHQEGRPLRVRFSPVSLRTVPTGLVLVLTDLTGSDPLSW